MTVSDRPRTGAPARAESVSHNGLAITRRVRPELPDATPLVILVHGAMDRSASFGRVMRRLPEYEVIAYDRRGYAGSRPADPSMTIARHGADLIDVIDFGLANSPLGRTRRPVVLIGHSLGGTVCMWVAANASNPAAAMGVYEAPAPWLDDSYLAVGGGTIEVAAEHGNATGAEYFYRMMIGEQTFSRLRETDLEERRADGDALIPELESLRDPLQAFELSRITIPVLLGSGENSAESMRRNARLVAAAIVSSTTVSIPSAAHGVHLSRPDAFADFVRACVARAESKQEAGRGDE